VANLLVLVLAFGPGMLVRVDQMPDFLQSISPFLPTYHYAQLAWGSIGASSEDVITSVAWLTVSTAIFFGVAAWAYHREAARKFG
jgi:ABC-2 type transport system permease protein